MTHEKISHPPAGLTAEEILRNEVAALREDIHYLTLAVMSSSDRQHLRAVIGVAAHLMGTRAWSARDLAAAARGSVVGEPLLQVIAAHGAAAGGLKAFGRLLSRCDGKSSGGLRLCKVGAGDEGCLYTVVRLSTPSKPIAALAAGDCTAHDGYSFVRSPDGPA